MTSLYAESPRLSALVTTGTPEITLRHLRQASALAAPSIAAQLADAQALLGDELREVEAEIAGLDAALAGPSANGTVDRARLAARHLLRQSGKRVRPMCVLLAARLGDAADPHTVRALALASELVHNATLLHDDVIDEGRDRRGVPTARRVFGNSASVLGGDQLLVHALRLVASTPLRPALPRLLSVIEAMVSAESRQLVGRITPIGDPETVLEIIRGKTGALFAWSLESGGRAAGLAEAELERLAQIGMAAGVAFQLIDDALDLEGEAETLGKATLVDLREGKVTWPVLVAVERHPDLLECLALAAQEPEPGRHCRELAAAIRQSGALDETRRRAAAELDRAQSLLLGFVPGAARQALGAVLASFVERRR